MSSPRLDNSRQVNVISRVMTTGTKSYQDRRAAAEGDVMTFLANVGGSAAFAELLAIYHLHYSAKEGRRPGSARIRRRENASTFLRRMEDERLIVCTYDRDGVVLHARLRIAEGEA